MHNFNRILKPLACFIPLLMAVSLAACGGSDSASTSAGSPQLLADTILSPPMIVSTSPKLLAVNVPTSTNSSNNIVTGTVVTATFNEAMNPLTIASTPAGTLRTFTLKDQYNHDVPGTVAMNASNTVASFTPSAPALMVHTWYFATMTTAAHSAGGIPMLLGVTWTFKTNATVSTAQASVQLGTAGNFVILSETGISTVPNSALTGDIGTSPIAHTAITGFSETLDSSGTFSTSTQVVGKIYAADYAAPTPTYMTGAIGDMGIAYGDASGRLLPDHTELGSGEIGGLTLSPGLYKWGTGVSISSDVILNGGPNDVWIFQIAGNISEAAATNVTLSGGALAKNIFWQTTGSVAIGATAHFEGVILSKTLVAMQTGASANGRLLAQTAVTLDQNAVTQPAP